MAWSDVVDVEASCGQFGLMKVMLPACRESYQERLREISEEG